MTEEGKPVGRFCTSRHDDEGLGGSGGCWTTPSSQQRLRNGVVVWMRVFAWMVEILNINFEPLTFCCALFVSSILVSENVIVIDVCKVLTLRVTFVSETSTRYGGNITKVWQEILTPMTLAFSCKVVHKKLWKSVNICKSNYGEKISGTFLCRHGVSGLVGHTAASGCPSLSQSFDDT